ncbi:iron-containing redox enzyme family protein [Bdellovibrio sp. 22V]|uniref:iron-containing redox enzyme family protein n=1 Tax=Bdellovibrio TaxID=958 RepID=UPI002543790E|nr:iron-containing redox enzyme family protein [Bdellovibrio sp. 22V]WII73759.1 iron-containing redox enzyme family protein [Bdellovibrio sp. 22V]
MKNKKIFTELNKYLERTGEKLVKAPWTDPNFYAAWCAQTTYYVRHSTRLLALAGAHTAWKDQEFHNRFLKHAAEEKGHENLTLLDLKHLDRKIENIPEFAATQSFYQPQYYWIEKVSPMAFYGYILCLECLAAQFGPPITKKLTEHYGPKGAHFWRVHSEEDPGHVEEAVSRVEKFPEEVQEIVLRNMIQSFENYEKILESCANFAAQPVKKVA